MDTALNETVRRLTHRVIEEDALNLKQVIAGVIGPQVA